MSKEIDELNQKIDALIKLVESPKKSERIPLKKFCEAHEISRPTCYAWDERGLISMEKVGGRQYVKSDSITVVNKYQRK